MPIGKDSIKTRVAKVSAADTTDTAALAPVKETAPAARPKSEASAASKKPAAPRKSTASKADTAAPKAPAKRKTAASKAEAPAPQAMPIETAAVETAAVDTAVLANVAPETVEAVVGHKEDAKVEHVQVGQKMPNYLL